jgi:hypothetical protein
MGVRKDIAGGELCVFPASLLLIVLMKSWVKIFPVAWGITVIISLFILPFKWAAISFLFAVAIGPVFSMPVYSLFKKFLDTKIPNFRNFFSGLIEAMMWIAIFYFISKKFNPSNWFYVFALTEYYLGQMGRVFRSSKYEYDREEFEELAGFSITMLIFATILALL